MSYNLRANQQIVQIGFQFGRNSQKKITIIFCQKSYTKSKKKDKKNYKTSRIKYVNIFFTMQLNKVNKNEKKNKFTKK